MRIEMTTEADDLIDNWRAYYKDSHSKRRTASLEGLYVPERVDGDDNDAPIQISKPVDHKQAAEIEKIVISLPMRYKLVLVVETFYRFVLQNNNCYNKTCRKNGINPRNWDDDLRKAKFMVLNRFNHEIIKSR